MKASKISGAHAIIASCEHHGVTHIFGYPGGANIPILDALYESKVKFVLTRHEQGAAHMADGYARASGKVGVVLVTSGPGALNTISGILTSQMDSIPLVIICGQTITANLGLDAFQEADVSGVTYPIVKHSYLVKNVADIPRIMKEAFYLAGSGRPGVVLIDVPKDISSTLFEPNYLVEPSLPGYVLPSAPSAAELAECAAILASSEKPVLLVGHGALIGNASEYVTKIARDFEIPVVNTLLGKGGFDENEALSLGMLGMHGTAYANMAVLNCDCIVSIGSRFDDRIVGTPKKFCPSAKKIHIDIDESEKNKMVKPDLFILGDASQVLKELIPYLKHKKRDAWLSHIAAWKKDYPLTFDSSGPLTSQAVLEALNRLAPKNIVYTTDVGQHQMWAAQFCKVHAPHSWLTSGGAGTMGYGFPAAIGAQIARPQSTVVAIVGDGGFQMTQAELSTAMLQKLPLKILILDNKYLGMVRQWQDLFYDNRLMGVDLEGNPDFVMLAKAYGVAGFHCNSHENLDAVLKEALSYNQGPCLIHAEVEKEGNVYPMIPAGAGYEAMLLAAPTQKLEKPKGST